MSELPPHPGDVAITNALLMGVEFTGSEVEGFVARGPTGGPYSSLCYSKRLAAIKALRYMGYGVDDITGEPVKL